MPSALGKQLPTLSNQLNAGKGLGSSFTSVSDAVGRAGDYAQDAQSLVKGNLDEIKSIDKTIESEVLQMEGMDQLQGGAAIMKELPTDSAALEVHS